MLPAGVRVYVACGVTDMRKGFDGLAALVQTALALDPYSGAVFLFRGRRGDLLKALLWDGQGLVLYAKRLERGRFVWPRTMTGTGERPREHLAGFSGFLHADAYAGYGALYRASGNQPPLVTHVACFAHARRKFFEVLAATKSPIAEEAVHRIARLYEVEAEITGKPAEIRLAARRTASQPLLDEFKTWADRQRRRLSSKTALGKAFGYALGRWDALTRFATDGRLSIDNNLSERLLRAVAITRKNFMFVGSDRGGDRAAIFYTPIETAKINGLDPEAYIAAVIDRMAKGHNSRALDALLPWNFKPAEPKPE
jgi:hypothetical protein